MKTNSIWYPYTQHKTDVAPIKIIRGEGDYLITETQQKLIDGISSWWCAIHGYNHPKLNQALKDQIDQISHVMLAGLTHQPALGLAKKLVEIAPEGLQHVFFGDSGSVGVEIAIKLAQQYWKNKGHSQKSKFISLKFAYHGDTAGAMSISDPVDSMHHLFSQNLPQHLFITSPAINYEQSLNELKKHLKNKHEKIAAFIVEPLVQGAGGLRFYPASFLKEAHTLCKTHNTLFICDEIATGFGRTGTLFAVNQANLTPDIMILGKALTGGYLGHSATLTTTEIFQAFYSKDPQKAFMHGPTFMGNPLACSVALKSIQLFEQENYLQKIKDIESILKEEWGTFFHPLIKEVRIKGAIGVIEFHNAQLLKSIQKKAIEAGVWIRPFNDILYLMPPYIISKSNLEYCCRTIKRIIETEQ